MSRGHLVVAAAAAADAILGALAIHALFTFLGLLHSLQDQVGRELAVLLQSRLFSFSKMFSLTLDSRWALFSVAFSVGGSGSLTADKSPRRREMFIVSLSIRDVQQRSWVM